METTPLHELMDFPAVYTFRAVAATLPGLPQACADAVESALGRAPELVSAKPSAKGKWTSVRVTAQVESAEEVLAAYAALKQVDGVKMTL